jgi:hypothetical protein
MLCDTLTFAEAPAASEIVEGLTGVQVIPLVPEQPRE